MDWVHVDPSLLQKINATAKARGQMVDIISGYRSPDYNKKVGGAEHSLHTQGRAIDAYIDGQPIGEVWDQSTFEKLGLRSGNQPNFFNGKPDPEHVDLGTAGGGASDTSGSGSVTSYAPSDQSQQQPSLADQIQSGVENSASIGPAVGPNVLVARDALAPSPAPSQLPPRFKTWTLLSQLPGASDATMNLAQLASLDNAQS